MSSRPEGAAPAIIADHPFTPRDPAQPWGLCECKLSEAAHSETTVAHDMSLAYRCPYCVDRGRKVCEHEGKPLHPVTAEPL